MKDVRGGKMGIIRKDEHEKEDKWERGAQERSMTGRGKGKM